MNTRRRQSASQANRAYAMSAQGMFESARHDFGVQSHDPNTAVRARARQAALDALDAGELRIAEVAGTQFEAGWRDAVASFRAIFEQWDGAALPATQQ